jgi:hypothetical protein
MVLLIKATGLSLLEPRSHRLTGWSMKSYSSLDCVTVLAPSVRGYRHYSWRSQALMAS